jgi:hypothetical protein
MLMAAEQGSTSRTCHFTPLRFVENLVATVLFGLIIVLAQALGIIEDGKVMAAEKRRRPSGGVSTRKKAACGDAEPLSGHGI